MLPITPVAAKERPILFSAPMVRAILEGRKTQTRRVVKPQPIGADYWTRSDTVYPQGLFWPNRINSEPAFLKPRYGQPGDRLWVRETWAHVGCEDEGVPEHYVYRADGGDYSDWESLEGEPFRWRPSIHMPRWASRLTLEITGVRVERLQEISETDAKAEGVEASGAVEMKDGSPCYTLPFERLWERINGCDSWAANPWVWVYEFQPIAD